MTEYAVGEKWEELKMTSQPVPWEVEYIKVIDEEGEAPTGKTGGTDWLGAQRSGFGLQSLTTSSLETLDV